MRELSVFYCSKCGYYGYYQLPKNAVCHKCSCAMVRLDMAHQNFVNLNYEERDRLLAAKMIESAPSLACRITAPEKLYRQRKLVGALTHRILELEKEVDELNDTIEWMHTTIWNAVRQRQELKEEIQYLKDSANPDQPTSAGS